MMGRRKRPIAIVSAALFTEGGDFSPPPSVGGSDLNRSSSGCARLGSGVAPPLGVVKEEVAVLIVLVRRHRRAVGAAAVDDEVFFHTNWTGQLEQ